MVIYRGETLQNLMFGYTMTTDIIGQYEVNLL